MRRHGGQPPYDDGPGPSEVHSDFGRSDLDSELEGIGCPDSLYLNIYFDIYFKLNISKHIK